MADTIVIIDDDADAAFRHAMVSSDGFAADRVQLRTQCATGSA
jgi:hypothetical protein